MMRQKAASRAPDFGEAHLSVSFAWGFAEQRGAWQKLYQDLIALERRMEHPSPFD
jgi:hypothetical protein